MIHILFDVDGVLINNFHVDPARAYLWWLDPAQKLIDAELMNAHFFKPRWHDILIGKKDVLPELEAALREINANISAEHYLNHWLKADSHINHELLTELRKLPRDNVRLSLATNQEHKRAEHLWHTLNFKADFDQMFYAAQLGITKPDVKFFSTIARDLGISDKDTVVYFDDTSACTAAATTLDWHTVIYSELEHFTEHPIIKELLDGRPQATF